MHHFTYINNELFCEDVSVADIADQVGTPFYLYSHATLKQHFRAFDGAFSDINHLTCFSMKSNSNLAVLRLVGSEGGGVDIVSAGELYRALQAGIDPKKIVYSGVGKRDEDIEYALKAGIFMFNAESAQEIVRLNHVGGKVGRKARIAIRVNPDVDPKTHPYISTGLKENKFGIDINDAPRQYMVAAGLENLDVAGVDCHIGSQLTQVGPFVDALKKVKILISGLRNAGIKINCLDIGGGLGITYKEEEPPHPVEYAQAIKEELSGSDLTLILEPGRVIVGNAGILVTRVIYTKTTGEKTFFVVDAAMNDLMRPSLYDSYHEIKPVKWLGRPRLKADIVGPICESGDFFAKSREVESFESGELMAIMSAGAYGFSMSSVYNSRPRACEVMVKDDHFYTIRARETYEDLIRGEVIPDFMEKA
ncbi:Diaminopimelate decarboxylase [uncultured Desulfobacterium sp.]|uniref:Diaminopimelate decarboxylase n=1 Tax=uncultured Desulfobacterium sp. TaxID=201089 RepID=A0A445MVS1_9BACT|nr:Diaminopimelate decarboxylase [uncultured Desulfobacterium sp.]